MKKTEWRDKYEIILERAKILDDIYGNSEDALDAEAFLPQEGEKHFNWFWNRKDSLYNIRLVRVPFLTQESLKWITQVRELQSYYMAGGGKKEILNLKIL